jgi:molybdenum cofactor guanylyltransferase
VITAIVLCGGSSRRLGRDKLSEPLGAATVLDALLGALPSEWPVVAVGPDRPTARHVAWTRESPTGGGPVAGIAAGIDLVKTDILVVVAGDMPFVGPWLPRLVAALQERPTVAAVVAVDQEGRRNPLLGAYRVSALRAALPANPANSPARRFLEALTVATLVVPDKDALDVDTAEQLAAARSRLAP